LVLVVILAAALPCLAAEVPAVGGAAPAISLPSQAGTTVNLDQYKGKWVVLYFYPKDFTSGCTIEAHNFQRDLDKYTAKNAGIGAAMARRLGRDGNKIALAARRADLLQEVARQTGPDAIAVTADVTRRHDVERLRDEALRAFGAIDVWINNAGRGISRSVLE